MIIKRVEFGQGSVGVIETIDASNREDEPNILGAITFDRKSMVRIHDQFNTLQKGATRDNPVITIDRSELRYVKDPDPIL